MSRSARKAALRAAAIALYYLEHEPHGPPSRGEQAEAILLATGNIEPDASTGANVRRAAETARHEVYGSGA